MRQAVYGTARLGLHREFSDYLKRSQGGGDLSALASAGSAMAAGAIASVIGTPFDVSLVRMQADGMKPAAERRGYKNVFDAIGRISREEGVTKLWRGFEPTAFRAIAMNVGMMASYDQAKQAIRKVNGDNVATNLSASAISGFTASFTSLPFDMMKTRLQNMKPDPATGLMPYKNVLDCGMKIVKQEGVMTFWRGFRYVQAVAFACYPLHPPSHAPPSCCLPPRVQRLLCTHGTTRDDHSHCTGAVQQGILAVLRTQEVGGVCSSPAPLCACAHVCMCFSLPPDAPLLLLLLL